MSQDPAKRERRAFIRHPSDIPINCVIEGHLEETQSALRDISHGGLRFRSTRAFACGDMIGLNFPTLRDDDVLHGEIVWLDVDAETNPPSFLYGMRFLDQENQYHARLVEQICRIEQYRSAQADEHGRVLSSSEAASEWIEKCAERFSDS